MSSKEDDRESEKNTETSEPNVPTEGVFKRPNFAKTVTSLIGNNVKVKTKKGSTYEGVFSTLTSDFEVIVDLSHEIGPEDPFYDRANKGSIFFKPEDIVSISCVNVNLKEALDISQQLDFLGDLPAKNDDIWNDNRQNSEPYDKGWNELLRAHKGNFGNSEYSEGLASFSPTYTHSETTGDSAFDDQKYDLSRDYPTPQKKAKMSPGESISGDCPGEVTEKTSNLNPNAKPFIPIETTEKAFQIPLAAVVLPTHVVSGNSSKLDAIPQVPESAASLLGGGFLQNQYTQYPHYDEKLYSPYDSLPISAHDYQQYYPHLQYIQYFRRFY